MSVILGETLTGDGKFFPIGQMSTDPLYNGSKYLIIQSLRSLKMDEQWYYVDGGERKGPVELSTIKELISNSNLGAEDFVWKKGFENWTKVSEVAELHETEEEPAVAEELPGVIGEEEELRLKQLSDGENNIFIKIGADRGGNEVEYGPYSLDIIVKLFRENRINAKTFIFIRGMTDWRILAEMEDFAEVFEDTPPPIEDTDRRASKRKPFIARMYIESKKQVFVGVCRDISVGGMQVLVENIPAKIGESISINVHPENTEHHFVAGGEVVRMLDGGQGFSFRFTDLGEDAKEAIQNYLTHG